MNVLVFFQRLSTGNHVVCVLKWVLSNTLISKLSIEAESLAARGREQADSPAASARTRRADFRDRDLVAHRVTPPRAASPGGGNHPAGLAGGAGRERRLKSPRGRAAPTPRRAPSS